MDKDAKHLSRVARGMRDEGVPPDRDLLPEINAAIDREESRRSVRSDRRAVPWPRLLAVAAALTVVLVSAWTAVYRDEIDLGSIGGPQLAALDTAPASASEADGGGLGVIDQALDELNAALNADPENRNLSSLVLMVHKKRGDLLRRTEGTGMLD
jgi:hypothetical protein